MKTDTRYFGPVEYEEDDVLTFPRGLYGFEDQRRFLLLPFAGSESTMLCLQSLDTPSLAFVVLDPASLVPGGYAPSLQDEDLAALGSREGREVYPYVMCVVKDPVGESTVNLRCPVVVNEETGVSLQTILEDDRFGMRQRLEDIAPREEDPRC